MKRCSPYHIPIFDLAIDLLLVYAAYTLCRLAFLLTNWALYAGTLSLAMR